MFSSLNSSQISRTLRGTVLAVTIASLATACGGATESPVGTALPDLTNVAESSPAPAAQTPQQSDPLQPSDSDTPPASDVPDARVPLDVPEGAELTILSALAADNAPAEEAKKTCGVKDGSVSHGSTATIIIKDADAGTTRTRTAQCQDGVWVTISDVTVNDTGIVAPDEPENPGPLGQISLPTAPDQVATG